MNTVKFIKSFSKGQITIPKEFRDVFGVKDEFWLKLYIANGKLVGEPIEQEKNGEKYLEKLLTIKGDWFSYKEFRKTRDEIEKRTSILNP